MITYLPAVTVGGQRVRSFVVVVGLLVLFTLCAELLNVSVRWWCEIEEQTYICRRNQQCRLLEQFGTGEARRVRLTNISHDLPLMLESIWQRSGNCNFDDSASFER